MNIKIIAFCAYISSATAAFCADSINTAPPTVPNPSAPTSLAPDGQEWSEGEVVQWNPASRKVTLRHGPLKNLGMPAMTMVFQIPNAAITEPLKIGAKIFFRAEQIRGAYILTHIQAAS